MLKLWDYQCMTCSTVRERLLDKEECKHVKDFRCEVCEEDTSHKRLPPLFAKPLQEQLREHFNPQVHGGKFDTMGSAETAHLPEMEGDSEREAKAAEVMASLPEDATKEQRMDAHREIAKDAPTLDDYKGHFATREFQEAKAERKARVAENKAKKARAKLVSEGKASMRDIPLPGDPKELHK